MKVELTYPPKEERARELWLQHAAGYIIFKDVRDYAINLIPKNVDESTRELMIKSIDDTVYGLMMIMDGVTGYLGNAEYKINIQHIIQLKKNGVTIQELDTFHGDGMCMGYHGWKEGDFGVEDIYPVKNIND